MKGIEPIHIVNGMNRFAMSAVTRQVFILTALGVEDHSIEASKCRNQYAKRAVGPRYFNIAPKSFKRKTHPSAAATAAHENSSVGQIDSSPKSQRRVRK
jgi:hypothetical protein